MTLKIHLSMSEFVCLNTFCTFGPTLKTINQGEGAKVYTLERSQFTGSPKISIGATRKVSYCGRSLKCDATYQPQLKMLLLLHLWEELLQI